MRLTDDEYELRQPPKSVFYRGGRPHQRLKCFDQLNADQAVNYGIVAKAISSVDRAGVERLSVMTAGE